MMLLLLLMIEKIIGGIIGSFKRASRIYIQVLMENKRVILFD